MKNTVLIIGAGAAGLMAAHTLSKAGKQVTVLEARDRTGGRIHTLSNTSFFDHTELGAEFIHGDLPVTLNLLKDAGLGYRSADAEMWRYEHGRFEKNSMIIDEWNLLMDRLNGVKQDINIDAFLQKEFPANDYRKLHDAVWSFVSGYDTADPHDASVFALRKEWQNEDDNSQHRINGGYCNLINYMVTQCKANNGRIFLNAVVKHISWKEGHDVKVTTIDETVYEAEQLLIAMPLGVLKAGKQETGTITFEPEIAEYTEAINKMGFGAVIKLLLEFKDSFWLDDKTQARAGSSNYKMGYLFSDEEIPTWWTQVPDNSKVLTGWIGGPAAKEKTDTPDEIVLEQGLQSLANIFNRDVSEIKNNMIAYRIMNWTADAFTRGSYAYDTVEAPEARKVLNTPLANTIFFTGEYLYEGTAMGTVEAALTSGQDVAAKILA
jgi:monoamine oxidase